MKATRTNRSLIILADEHLLEKRDVEGSGSHLPFAPVFNGRKSAYRSTFYTAYGRKRLRALNHYHWWPDETSSFTRRDIGTRGGSRKFMGR